MIILAGNIGSGKTEQAHRLSSRKNWPLISTGQLLRNNPNTERLERMVSGQLVDDDDIIQLLSAEFGKIGAARNELILDGAPRSPAQTDWLISQIKAGSIKFTAAIHLTVSEPELWQRLATRQRSDDEKAIAAIRMKEYENTTKAALDTLAAQGFVVQEINGEGSVEEVEARIDQALGI